MGNNRRKVKLFVALEGEIENRREVQFHGEQSTCSGKFDARKQEYSHTDGKERPNAR